MKTLALKNGSTPWRLLLGLAAFLLPAYAAAVTDIRCTDGDQQLRPAFQHADGIAACKKASTASECQVVIDRVEALSTSLLANRISICDRAKKFPSELASFSGQDNSFALSAQQYSSLIGDYKVYSDSLAQAYQQLKGLMLANAGPLGAPSALTKGSDPIKAYQIEIRKNVSSDEAMKRASPIPAPTLAAARNSAPLFAGQNGADFMKKILTEKDKIESTISGLTTDMNKIIADGSRLKGINPNSPTPTASSSLLGGSGLNLGGIASLATAGAGLFQMFKKPDSAADAQADATSPTPKSPFVPTTAALTDGQGKSTAGSQTKFVGSATATDTATNTAAVPSGTSGTETSDINKSNALSSTSTTGGFDKGTYMGSSSHSGSDSAANAASSAKRDPSAAAPETHKEDEAMQGIGNGGLGGGGPPPGMGGSSSSMPNTDMPPLPGGEDPMKDLLNDMKDSTEAGAAGNENGQSSADIPMTDEDLFPRVSACIQRNLKRGQVLNGLGDRVTPENP